MVVVEVEGTWRRGGSGRESDTSSSSVEASVGRFVAVGEMMDAVLEAGSSEAMELRMLGMETRDSVLKDNGQLGSAGGESGESWRERVRSCEGLGVDSSSALG